MNAMLEAYRNSCNQLTIRISELSQQIQQTCSQTEADCLNHRKHLLQTERLELLRDMQDMQPHEKSCLSAALSLCLSKFHPKGAFQP